MYDYELEKVAKSTKNIRRDIDWNHASYDKNELEKSKNHFVGKKRYGGLLGVGNSKRGIFRDKSSEENYKTLAGEENSRAINRNILRDQAIGAGIGAGYVARGAIKHANKFNTVADIITKGLEQTKGVDIDPKQLDKAKKIAYRGGAGALALGAGLVGSGVATAVSPSRRLKKQLKNSADAKNMINAYHEDKERRGGSTKMAYGYYQEELEKMARSAREISKDVDWDKAQFDANELDKAKAYFGKERYSGRGGVGDRYYGAERDKSNELTYEDFLSEEDAKSLNTRANIAKGIGVGGVGGFGAYKSAKKAKKKIQNLTNPTISELLKNHITEEAYSKLKIGESALKATRKPKKIRNAILWGGAKTGIAGAIGYQGAKALSKSIQVQNRLNEIADAQNMINAYNEDRERRARNR